MKLRRRLVTAQFTRQPVTIQNAEPVGEGSASQANPCLKALPKYAEPSGIFNPEVRGKTATPPLSGPYRHSWQTQGEVDPATVTGLNPRIARCCYCSILSEWDTNVCQMGRTFGYTPFFRFRQGFALENTS